MPDHPLSVRWVLFSFRGRIGRKTFLLAALLLLLIQAALFAFVSRYATIDGETANYSGQDAGIWAFLLLFVSWIASAWALITLAVKRLHDLDLPPILAVVLVIPAVAFLGWLFLAAMPSKQEKNEHGPVPFPKQRLGNKSVLGIKDRYDRSIH